jgi:xanthosine utilization system XapX-like protein
MRGLLAVAALLLAGANASAQTPEKVPPGGIADDPAPPGGKPVKLDASPPSELGTHQLGVRARYIFVTKAMLGIYFADNTGTQMSSWSVGMEYVYRRPGKSYDIVTSLDFSWLNVDDGNFLGSGHDPTTDTHYTQFRNLSFVSADVSIIGFHKFAPWFELRYGGGLGIGYAPGDVLITTNAGCTAANATDTTKCAPAVTGPINGKPTAAQEAALKATEGGGTDTAQTPHRHSGDSIPVMGVVNILVGFRFYPVKHMAITAEIGFRDTMFVGGSLHYVF